MNDIIHKGIIIAQLLMFHVKRLHFTLVLWWALYAYYQENYIFQIYSHFSSKFDYGQCHQYQVVKMHNFIFPDILGDPTSEIMCRKSIYCKSVFLKIAKLIFNFNFNLEDKMALFPFSPPHHSPHHPTWQKKSFWDLSWSSDNIIMICSKNIFQARQTESCWSILETSTHSLFLPLYL